MERQARESGICPIREELFSQCFDEIIRQVTINEPERGLLLLRVRDEIKMTIASYQTLYQNAVQFGMKKQIQAEVGKADLEAQIDSQEKRKKELEDRVVELKLKIEAIENRTKQHKEVLRKRKQVEEKQMDDQESHLRQFLKLLSDK